MYYISNLYICLNYLDLFIKIYHIYVAIYTSRTDRIFSYFLNDYGTDIVVLVYTGV